MYLLWNGSIYTKASYFSEIMWSNKINAVEQKYNSSLWIAVEKKETQKEKSKVGEDSTCVNVLWGGSGWTLSHQAPLFSPMFVWPRIPQQAGRPTMFAWWVPLSVHRAH